jgi:bisanhydrobacterioruberin hydratase
MKEKFVIPFFPVIIFFFSLIIAFSGFMVGSGYELRNQDIIGIVFTVIIGLPSLISFNSFSKGLKLIVILSLFAYFIESLGVLTGFPYGSFTYGDYMGLKLLGLVPLILPFAYVPLVLSAYYIADKLSGNKGVIVTITAFILVMFDLVLDPGAAALGYWIWEKNGLYYGIPFSNYLGWIFSSVIAGLLAHNFKDIIRNANGQMIIISSFWIMLFWTFVAIALGMIIPIIVGIIILLFLLAMLISKKARDYHYSRIL